MLNSAGSTIMNYFCSEGIMPWECLSELTTCFMSKKKNEAKAEHRTIAGQIEFWASVGRSAIDNPELSAEFVVPVLGSRKDLENNF